MRFAADSTSALKALTGKLVIKRDSPSIIHISSLFNFQICKLIKAHHLTEHMLQKERVPYFVHGTQWVGYDNKQSILEKVMLDVLCISICMSQIKTYGTLINAQIRVSLPQGRDES